MSEGEGAAKIHGCIELDWDGWRGGKASELFTQLQPELFSDDETNQT